MEMTKAGVSLTFKTQIDLSQETREEVVAILNQQLADTFDLYSQAKQAHWNVKGMDFIQLHKLFDEVAEPLLDYGDMIAERITALAGLARGTVHMAAASSTLEDYPTDIVSGEEFLEVLIERFANYAASTRNAIDATDELGDMGTSDLFTEIVRGVDKSLYFLEAHLRG
jgi:starvation-inducible DNA-binding protein